MSVGRHLPTCFTCVLLGAILAGTGAAVAEQYCFPHCDYVHYYGPFDLSYIRPGLTGYPQCGPHGDCAPHLADAPPRRGRITVRFPRVMTAPLQQ
jgi:hypothetical protein